MIHTEKWFISKVGKRIYRDDPENSCHCTTCQEVARDGLIVLDENHSKYLYMIQNDFGAEGCNMNYRSKK